MRPQHSMFPQTSWIRDTGQLTQKKKKNRALFYRSIAEMNFLGFVKQTRKRVDHLQTLAWKGL